MNDADFQLLCLRDPRLAERATDSAPAWLWTTDGRNVLWANPPAAVIFNASNARELSERTMGPADQHRRQVAQLAQRLPSDGAVRLERLRGFGARLGSLTTCACSRFETAGGMSAVLIVAEDAAERSLSLENRMAMVIDALDDPAAAFSRNGSFIAANHAAQAHPSFAATIVRLDIAQLALHVVDGKAAADPAAASKTIDTEIGALSLYPVGTGNTAGWIGLFSNVIVPETVQVTLEHSNAEVATAASDMPAAPDVEEASASEATTHQTAIVEPANGFAAEAAPERAIASTPLPETLPLTAAPGNKQAFAARQYPLRFLWQMDRDGRFSLGSDEFQRLIGDRTAFSMGRLWSDLANALGLDPDNRVAQAIATQNTWGSITVHWPVDGSETRLPIELSGLPVYDRARNFIGYRGFGVCRDLESLARLAAEREDDALFGTAALPAASSASDGSFVQRDDGDAHQDRADAHQDNVSPTARQNEAPSRSVTPASNNLSAASTGTSAMTDSTQFPTGSSEPQPAEDAQNVVPFRSAGDSRAPSLTVKETNTFNEIARQLTARLEEGNGTAAETPTKAADIPPASSTDAFPAWLSRNETTPQAHSARDVQLLDRLPVGVLIYRLDRMIYANRAFLDQAGFQDLHAFNEAGGLDALYIEPGANGDSTSENGAPLVIAGSNGGANTDARLYSIMWDGEPALALIYAAQREAAPPIPAVKAEPARDAHHDLADELSTILDTTAEGVLMFDGLGRVNSCNRSAEALFGRDGTQIIQGNLIDLFAPESQRIILDYLQSVKSTGVASLLDHGREVIGRARDGGAIPLAVTMGRTRQDGTRYFAVFRDLSQIRKRETELVSARKAAERIAHAKSDILGKLSHEVREPLGAIVGFADVMIQERFGPLGNERYVEYMKDIRTSGERVTAIIDDLLDLSRVESGKLDLSLTNQDLNAMVEQCVAVMQPQANRDRIIIRTSLAHALPNVKADVRALRQIALNLIGNSIQAANAGGQVIVSTAMTDFGDVVLRIRDSGQGLNDNEVAAAMAPFRTRPASDSIGVNETSQSLSLAKALVEANHAQFNIKTAPNAGTLIEVVFSHASAIA